MGSTKVLVTSTIIAVVAAVALLVPTLAFGQPLGSVLPGSSSIVVAPGDGDEPGNGQGKEWGHHKDSPDFPGQGKGLDKNRGDSLDDGVNPKPRPDKPRGNAFGHDKPGNPHNDDD